MAEKTNVMRVLDKVKAAYQSHSYVDSGAISGLEVAEALNQDPQRVFKTLVTVGKTKKYYVFLVPVAAELDLKKAAERVSEKAIEMLKAKDLLPLTGYVHGGCSPIGMKKSFVTVIDASAADLDSIIFSAGKIGYQVELSLEELHKAFKYSLADIVL